MRSFVSGVVEESVSRQESVRRCGGGRDKREFMHIPYLIWNIWVRFGFRPTYLLCSCFLCGVRWFNLCCFHTDKIQNPEIQFPKTQFRHSCAVRGYLGRQGNTGFSAIFSVCVFSVSNTILFWLI